MVRTQQRVKRTFQKRDKTEEDGKSRGKNCFLYLHHARFVTGFDSVFAILRGTYFAEKRKTEHYELWHCAIFP